MNDCHTDNSWVLEVCSCKTRYSCRYVVSFVMPSKYTKETLPKPNNENVKIKEIPERTFATYAWR